MSSLLIKEYQYIFNYNFQIDFFLSKLMISFSDIKTTLLAELNQIKDHSALNRLKIQLLSKNGIIAKEMHKISSIPNEERKNFGTNINSIRDFIIYHIAEKQTELENSELELKLAKESLDITLPGRACNFGKIHPLSYAMQEIKEIFNLMGFQTADGPEIEDDWHNFTALNVPEIHPARQLHDTFYVADKNLLLRTHTSSVQVRHMLTNKPPIKIISMGKVYRSDYDSTHTPMFHQVEVLYIDKSINFGHLKSCLSNFLKLFFELKEVPMRLRSSYFPFTEPSVEVDIKCDRSNKQEIKIGKGNNWLEILGCGMIHQNVLHNVGIDPKIYQGFALGAGIERLAMLKYNIPDLRTFFDGDMRWIQHYGF